MSPESWLALGYGVLLVIGFLAPESWAEAVLNLIPECFENYQYTADDGSNYVQEETRGEIQSSLKYDKFQPGA